MTATSHIDLLADLIKLLKKHGPETFRSLAAALRDPDQLASLSETLEVLSQQSSRLGASARERTPQRTGLRKQLDTLAETAPDKAALLRQLLEQLMASDGIPLSDLRTYARQAGLPQLKSGNRARVAQAFVAALLDLDVPQIRKHIEQLAKPQENDRDLAGWSRIILDPNLRSAKTG
ncbi:MAG: hypothetical protein L0241_24515 [Planctomycetia bacterium]|nr:hypothetical protein [Planctomycetia bacterium]